MTVVWEGLDKVVANLNKEIRRIEGVTLKGLIRAAIQIRYDMAKTSPLIPIDTGNLNASFFTVTSRGVQDIGEGKSPSFKGEKSAQMATDHLSTVQEAQSSLSGGTKGPTAIIGFSAYYAGKVHEDVGGTYKRPGSGAKFLEAAIKRNQKRILEIIREEARIR